MSQSTQVNSEGLYPAPHTQRFTRDRTHRKFTPGFISALFT